MALLSVVVGLASACGSQTDFGGDSSGVATPAPSSAPQPVTTSFEATYSATGQDGDSATIRVHIGTPEVASKVTAGAVTACAERIPDLGRAVAVPVTLSAVIDSSLSGDLRVRYGGTAGVVDDGQFNALGLQFWAGTYGTSGSACGNPQDYEAAGNGVVWKDTAPGTRRGFTGWLVVPQAISPSQPSAADFGRTLMLDTPIVSISQQNLEVTLESGAAAVTCGASGTDPAAGGRFRYVAADVDTATSQGCAGL